MQFEDFDKKIKEAAENHHPAYDEQAWAKMNKLLDKHMPEKDERRRRFAWLFFLLFLAGGAGIFYGVQSLVSSNSAGSVAVNRSTATDSNTQTKNTATGSGEKITAPAVILTDQTGSGDLISKPVADEHPALKLPIAGEVNPLSRKEQLKDRTGQHANSLEISGNITRARSALNNVQDAGDLPVFRSGQAVKKKKAVKQTVALADKKVPDVLTDKQNQSQDTDPAPVFKPEPALANSEPAAIAVDPVNAGQMVAPADSAMKAADVPVAAINPAKKSSTKKQSRFFISLSAGPDASFTRNGKPGRIIPVTGAGIGYIYRERFSIRAGFYNAAKIYTASPDAYNAPANFYNYYPFLVKVDANCRVYEIPVSVGYHFGARKNHSWFASATLSSYLMKRETYNYSYKTSAWGAIQQREWNLYNRNEHLFSVLGLSGGYQRKISERISFIAEPYFRMPLQGVGYGKVKLNSAGVLFSLAVQPAALVPRKQKK